MTRTNSRTPREAHERALAGVCSHGGHGWDGDTCSDIDEAIAAERSVLAHLAACSDFRCAFCLALIEANEAQS